MRQSPAPAAVGRHQVEPTTVPGPSVTKPVLRSTSRRARRAAKLFDRHGAAVHTMASVLTTDPLHSQTLVVGAINSRLAPPMTQQNTEKRSVRELAASVYVAWSCRPAPPTPIVPPSDVRLPSSTLAAIHLLPEDHRAALALCAYGDHTYTQAARVLGLPAPKVAGLLREALLTLRRPLGVGVAS